MLQVRVDIVRYTDSHQPGWVECHITDVHGRVWAFEEKVPVVADAYLDADSPYPQVGWIGCRVVRSDGGVTRVGVNACAEYVECDVASAAVKG